MLVLAWLVAPVCSIPQSFIFRLKTHPLMQEYRCHWKVMKAGVNINMSTVIRITNAERGYECEYHICTTFQKSQISNSVVTSSVVKKHFSIHLKRNMSKAKNIIISFSSNRSNMVNSLAPVYFGFKVIFCPGNAPPLATLRRTSRTTPNRWWTLFSLIKQSPDPLTATFYQNKVLIFYPRFTIRISPPPGTSLLSLCLHFDLVTFIFIPPPWKLYMKVSRLMSGRKV